ncbi:MAG: hypothetical protein Q9170_008087 [Blastenia crenularia]
MILVDFDMTNGISAPPLHRADGSAICESNGHLVIAAINGPIEVQRKDEIPDEAAIDVALRPAVGVGGVRERHLELLVEQTLRQLIHVSAHPRTLIQVTLQVLAGSSGSNDLHQSASNLSLLPALLQSSVLALLSTSISLTAVLTSQMVAVSPSGELLGNPGTQSIQEATSLHVFAFSSQGSNVLSESEGAFSVDIWDQAYEIAEELCRGAPKMAWDCREDELRKILEEKIAQEQRWKEG